MKRWLLGWTGTALVVSLAVGVAGLSLASLANNLDEARRHVLRGLTYVAHNYLREAIAHLSEAARLAPGDLESQLLLALAYDAGQSHDLAVQRYRQVLQASDASPGFAALLGDLYLRQGRLDLAEQEYRRALREPDVVRAHFGLALVHEARDEPDLARARLEQVVELAPEMAEGRYRLARLLRADGLLDEAMGHLLAGKRQAPRHAGIQYEIGLIHEARGNVPAALHAYRYALQLSPGHAEAASRLQQLERTP